MKGKKIIIADDEPDIIRLIKYFLTKKGFEVLDFSSGIGLLDSIIREKPDLVILDVIMPGENGIDLCKKIKDSNQLKNIPVIILSAKTQKFEVEGGLGAGADEYLIKPFNTNELLEVVEKTIKSDK